jgi:pimeloyl-ACP methyl ester carboxylesterase
MAYGEWGDPANPRVLLCVHGLTRNGRDFDFLAQALAKDYRVVCPDVVGRGLSDWLTVASGYDIPNYAADMVTLIARLNVDSVDWLGTSMGGIIGMVVASLPGNPIRRLVLNDVGPELTAESLARIGQYVGIDPLFPDFASAEQFVRAVSAPFGPLSDAQWRHLTEHSVRSVDGGLRFRYDPGIAEPFRAMPQGEPMTLWPVYDAIRCPTLVLRGEHSDLLTRQALAGMASRGPAAHTVEIPGVGHAPMLMDAAQVAPVRDFLLAEGGA